MAKLDIQHIPKVPVMPNGGQKVLLVLQCRSVIYDIASAAFCPQNSLYNSEAVKSDNNLCYTSEYLSRFFHINLSLLLCVCLCRRASAVHSVVGPVYPLHPHHDV